MGDHGLLVIYCVLILLASLAGGWVPLLVRLTHRRMQLAISLVAGFMVGVALLHLLPHAVEVNKVPVTQAMGWLVAGLLVMFFIERFFCFHHHDAPEPDTNQEGRSLDHSAPGPKAWHDHGAEHELTWSGAAVGLTLHSVMVGVGLGASMSAESHGDSLRSWPGLAVFLVIVLHKPFDALSLGTLMVAGRWSVSARHLINGLFALAVPLGVVLFHFGLAGEEEASGLVAGSAAAFAAGIFLCISMSDLLPELQFHRHDRAKLSASLLVGLLLAWSVSHFEATTPSEHDQTTEREVHQELEVPGMHYQKPEHDRDDDHSLAAPH